MFLSDLILATTRPGAARLDSSLVWRDAIFGSVIFPAGYETDLGSTPQIMHRFRAFDPWYTGRKAAVGHDYLYAAGKWPGGDPVTRAQADEFLRVAIIAEGHSASVARLWWLGVRVGGWLPWGRYRRAQSLRSVQYRDDG